MVVEGVLASCRYDLRRLGYSRFSSMLISTLSEGSLGLVWLCCTRGSLNDGYFDSLICWFLLHISVAVHYFRSSGVWRVCFSFHYAIHPPSWGFVKRRKHR